MKSTSYTTALIVAGFFALIVLVAAKGNTAKSKVGYINTTQLWQAMPEKASADSTLSKMKTEFVGYYQQKQQQFELGVTGYKRDSASMSELIRKEKVDALLKEQESIKNFPKQADAELNKKKEELYAPIRQKMQKAIDAVAAENHYDYITDVSFGHIIYAKNTEDNILPLVKKKLGLQP
ncbi:MAG: OmpH family outer membrane protein [Flavobacteriales bacterium]|jgi:outer membrane protein|nr:OmpH family outer membrane protein [Flavobacteriales bacterium]